MNIQKSILVYDGILRTRCTALIASNFSSENEDAKERAAANLQRVDETAKLARNFIIDDLVETIKRLQSHDTPHVMCSELMTTVEALKDFKPLQAEFIDFVDNLSSIHGQTLILKEVFFKAKSSLETLASNNEISDEHRKKAEILVNWITDLRRI